jgi:hypothetical protein
VFVAGADGALPGGAVVDGVCDIQRCFGRVEVVLVIVRYRTRKAFSVMSEAGLVQGAGHA